MKARDPRVDPRAGDVLRKRGERCEVDGWEGGLVKITLSRAGRVWAPVELFRVKAAGAAVLAEGLPS